MLFPVLPLFKWEVDYAIHSQYPGMARWIPFKPREGSIKDN